MELSVDLVTVIMPITQVVYSLEPTPLFAFSMARETSSKNGIMIFIVRLNSLVF